METIKTTRAIRPGDEVALRFRIGRVVVALTLALLLFAPAVEAFRIPKYGFEAEVPPFSVAAQESPGGPASQVNFTLLTGAYRASGTLAGAFALIEGEAGGSVTGSQRIDVIDTKDREGAIGRFSRGECQSVSACSVERSFPGGTLTLGANATLIIYSEDVAIHHNVTSPFGLGIFVNASQALRNGPLGNVPVTNSLIVVGDEVALSGTVAAPTDSLYAILGNPNATVTVNDTTGSQAYRGPQFLFRFHGTPTVSMRGTGVGLPFAPGTSAVFRQADLDDVAAGFHPEFLNAAARALGGQDIVVQAIADGLRDLGPILNGVLLGRTQDPFIDGQEANASALGMVRFQRGVLTPVNDSALLTAESAFILLGSQGFYTDQDSVNVGFFAFPPFSLLLWLFAAVAIVLGFVLRPMLASAQPGAFGGIRLLGWIFHALSFAIAFIFWDQEIRNFLGTSFLAIWTEGAFGKGAVLAITASLEILSFLVAGLLFGMPIRFIVNSGLKLGGLKKARGVGKGIGNLATWGLGAPFIPFVLNGFVGAIVDALQKSLGGG